MQHLRTLQTTGLILVMSLYWNNTKLRILLPPAHSSQRLGEKRFMLVATWACFQCSENTWRQITQRSCRRVHAWPLRASPAASAARHSRTRLTQPRQECR